MTIGHNGGPPIVRGNDGWIAISRAIRTHWLVGFGQPPVAAMDPSRGAHSRSEAFIDLLMECRYAAGAVSNGGRKMELQPGQLVGAVSWLASRWNWTPKTVRTWLDKLEADGMIERASDQKQGKQAAIITVCNYSEYQLVQEQQWQAEGQQRASKGQAKGNSINKGTREQEGLLSDEGRTTKARPKNQRAYSERFEQFWQAYPDRTNNSKPAAAEQFECLDVACQDTAIASLSAFAAYCRKNPDYRCVHAERYLKDRRFDSYAEQARPAMVWWQDTEKVRAITDDQWRGSIAKYANGIWPLDRLGPAPGNPLCVVPRRIIAELRLAERYNEHGISKEKH